MSQELAPSNSASRAASSDLITTLLHRAPRLATAVAAGQLAWPVARTLHAKARERTTFTVKVPATDDIYDDLHEWVLGLLPTQEQRALVAWTSKRDNNSYLSSADDPAPKSPPRVRLRYDGSREQAVTIAGHRLRVVVADGDASGKDGMRWKPAEIVFTASSLAAQRALLDEINEVARRVHEAKRTPVFRMLDKWGEWRRVDELARRELDSVILPAGQLERLVADVESFLAAEQEYTRRCIPWHRGHLYEGPPGTGKTSVARALASHFGMDVWYLPLGDVKKDGDLLNVVNRIGPRSMLLLEDIDVFHAATQRNDEAGGVTLSGLLNALDGIATPHGLLTVMTTNTPDVLDQAVIRAGRVDLVEHLGLADSHQVARLLARWYGRNVAVPAKVAALAPAAVIEACKRYDHPQDAIDDLRSAGRQEVI